MQCHLVKKSLELSGHNRTKIFLSYDNERDIKRTTARIWCLEGDLWHGKQTDLIFVLKKIIQKRSYVALYTKSRLRFGCCLRSYSLSGLTGVRCFCIYSMASFPLLSSLRYALHILTVVLKLIL